MSEKFINTFDGGLDSDTAPNFRRNNTYSDAVNITLNTTGKYSVATNIKGTEAAGTIANSTNFPSGSKVLSVIQVSGVIADFQTDVNDYLLIFVYTSTDYLKIYLNKIHTSSVFLLFSELQTTPYTSLTTIDTVSYSENGIDTVYFTDNVNELRQITINVPAGADTTNGYLAANDLSVLRPAILSEIIPVALSGGSLLCGSYQFSIRLFNNENRKYTKWSLLTQPTQVSELTRGSYYRRRGGVGQYSSQLINILVKPTATEELLYTHFQLAVVQFIGVTATTSAKIIEPVELTGSPSGYTFEYVSNTGKETIDVSDIIVDKAAIKTCKTLTVKDNRLFLGNITYYDLEYDNGDPTATGSIETRVGTSTSYSLADDNASRYKGYMRGEVYRFAISYFDKFYNFSQAKVLDLYSITDNTTTDSTIPDLKFPSPSNNVKWGLFDKTSGNVQTLYPSLTINNHPSWAKGFVILRAKRIKRINFQTPLIPASKIDGVLVGGNYPFTATEGLPTPSDVNYDNAVPMNPLGTWIPKNFFFAGNRHALFSYGEGVSWVDGRSGDNSVYYITPPQEQYDTGVSTPPLVLKGNDCELFDVAFLKYDYVNYKFSASPSTVGTFSSTNTHGTFYAINVDDYYYSGTTGSKSPPYTPTVFSIAEYTTIPQNSTSNTLGSSFVSSYENLVTGNVQLGGETPSAQRLSAIKLTTSRPDVTYEAPTLTVPGGTIDAAQLPAIALTSAIDNTFAFTRTGGTINSDYVSAVEIINVINKGVSDNRYGSAEYQHEFISTGAYHVFSSSELTTVQTKTPTPIAINVFGGDIHVGLHQFKITDSSYGIQDDALASGSLVSQWGRYFKYDTGKYRLPGPYTGLSQVISVVLESDIRGSVADSPTYDTSKTISGASSIPLATLGVGEEGVVRSPFNYFYHPQYSIENDLKVFTPFNPISQNTVNFKSRIAYSNERIFSSDAVGFDLFNALDNYDLSETYGGINKLIINKDKLLALQQDGVFYIPVNARVLESSDALSLSVRSSEVIDRPISISNIFGTQSPKSSIQADNSVYVVDSKRSTVYKVTTDNLIEPISYLGVKTLIEDNGLIDGHISYNPTNGNIYIFSGDVCYLYNDIKSQWQSRLDFNDNILHTLFVGESTLLFQNYASGVYAFGVDQSNSLVAGVIDKKTDSLLHFGAALPNAFIKFTVNPNPHISKTFDTIILNSSSELASMSVTGFTPLSPSSSTLPLTLTDSGEGSQFVKVLRDASGKRIRGARSLMTVNWADDTVGDISLSAIITKYRESQKI